MLDASLTIRRRIAFMAAALTWWFVLLGNAAHAQNLDGTYDGTPDLGFVLTLTLETNGASVEGRLLGEGVDIGLSGTIEGADASLVRASGAALNGTGQAGFELEFVPATGALTLGLFEFDARGEPAPSTLVVTTFTARSATPTAAINPLAPGNRVSPPAAPSPSPWLGTFADGTVSLTVVSASAAAAEGTIAVAGETFPFRVKFDANGVGTGTFEANASSFPLRLTLREGVVTVSTEGAEYVLTRMAAVTPTEPPASVNPLSPSAAVPDVTALLALESDLDPTDDALESGQYYYEMHFVDLEADQPVTVEVTSAEFDVYLIVVDPNAGIVLEVDDSVDYGTDVRETFVPSVTGGYGIVVTSVFPKEQGRFALSVSAEGSSGVTTGPQGTVASGPAASSDASGTIATGLHGVLRYDAVDALIEALEFSLFTLGVSYRFSQVEREQAYAWFEQNYVSLPPSDQALYADARTVWTNVQANWSTSSETDRYEFVIGVLSLYFGEAQVRAWLGLPASGSGGSAGGTFEDWASANGIDTYDPHTSAAQGCWAAAGCSSYDPVGGYVYEDPSY